MTFKMNVIFAYIKLIENKYWHRTP